MITRMGETYTPTCDGCGEELEDEWDFMDAVDAIKAAGWRTVPPNKAFDYWSHFCPCCVGRCDFG